MNFFSFCHKLNKTAIYLNLITPFTYMGKHFVTLKIKEETLKKFKQAKRLREFKMDEGLTISEFLEIILENEFKKYDDFRIERVE